ncbi:MAG: SprB repeat-containing protein, partial [Bacteroidia bacterium]|nr:SprB repeat-containing protein [Bacteroidia bacterium]
MKKTYSILLLLLSFTLVKAQLTITPGGGAAAVISAIGGPGLTISNVTINCAAVSYGTYNNGGAGGLGAAMTNGLVLTTGTATQINGPGTNQNDDFTGVCVGSSSNDPQLVSVVGAGTAINDACIIEFDVVPQCNTLSIRFVFGSDEYTNWVSQGFNDGFGFWVSGPNPGGGNYTNYNMATLPNGTVVSIDNVNTTSNAAFFVNNNAGGSANHFDGFTTVLTPTMNVTPCATYHFKLAIADAQDCAMDSGVMIDVIQCVSPWTVATSSTPAACGVNNGSATATVSGGIGPFSYSWAPSGGTGATASGLAAGSYTVTVNDGLTCTPPQTYTVVVAGSGGSTATVNSPTICAGANATLTATPATGGGTYSWAPGGQTTQTINVSPGTTTTYTVTYTLAGCSNVATGTVTVNSLPTIAVNSTSICPGQNATLTATGGTTYAWSTGAVTNPITVSPAVTTSYTVTGTSSGCSSTAVATVTVGGTLTVGVNSPTICAGATATLTATGASTYSWNTGSTANPLNVSPAITTTYTVTGTTGGCSGTAVATVTVNPIPTVTSTSSTICNGQTTSLTAGGASTYSWNTGATGSNLTITPGATTTYTVTGTAAGCSNTATGTVTVNNAPTVTVNSPSICPGAIATLTANGATTYSWSTGATTNPITVSPVVQTTYTVTGTTLGCTATAVATVSMNGALIANAGLDDTLCFGQSVVLNASPNVAGSTFAWLPATGLSNTNTFNPTASPTTTTTYTVTITDANGCSGTDQVTIFADPQITLAIAGINVTCNGGNNGQTIVIPNGGNAPYTYSWTSGCTGASCTGLSVGSYTVTVTDAWGCTATGDTTITQPSALSAIASGTDVTCTALAICDGTATITPSGGVGPYTYSWNSVPVQTTQTATGLCAGTYTCTVTDNNGCTLSTTSVTISQPALVTIPAINVLPICIGSSANLTAAPTGGTGVYTFNWLPAGTGSTATVSVSPVTTITYTVSVADANGCTATTSVQVVVNPPLNVVTAGSSTICVGGQTSISATAGGGNGGPYNYSWAPAIGLSNPLVANPTANPSSTTTYTVTVTDNCGTAPVTATATVTVQPAPTILYSADVISGCAPLCVTFTDASSVTNGTITNW